jgi:fibro-slime domain-containing protein
VTYRDFAESHPDFEMIFSGDVVRLGLLSPSLGADGKPELESTLGCPARDDDNSVCADWDATDSVIASVDSFHQWYHTDPSVNQEVDGILTLTETTPGSGTYVYDNSEFFPLAPTDGFGPSPAGESQNFLFTTEIHLNFQYVAGQSFSFRGDDDLWIFVNGRLALDLGSLHSVEAGTIDFDAQAAELGIEPGGSYSMDIFHAERHTTASNFRFETNISCFRPGVAR